MTPQPSEQRAALRERLRKLDDTPHDSWPRWTYRDYVNVSNLLVEAEAAAPDPVASPPEALRLLRELLDATDPPNVAWVNTGADLERLVAARAEARRYLAATEEETP